MNNLFSVKRLGLSVNRTVRLGWRDMLTSSAAVGGIYVLISMFVAYEGTSLPWLEALYYPFLFIAGAIGASTAFREFSHKDKNLQSLILPNSSVERFLEKWLVFTPAFVVGSILFTVITSIVANLLGLLLFNNSVGIFNPLQIEVWKVLPYFLVFQSIFYLGSAWFRKAAFFKVILSLFGLNTIFSILGFFLMFLFIRPYAQDGSFFNHPGSEFHIQAGQINTQLPQLQGAAEFYWGLLKVLFWTVLPISYIISWFRLKEREVSHGI